MWRDVERYGGVERCGDVERCEEMCGVTRRDG
jgi:hypothetical protein